MPVRPMCYFGRQNAWRPATIAPALDLAFILWTSDIFSELSLSFCLRDSKPSRKGIAVGLWLRRAIKRRSETSSPKGYTSELAALVCVPKQKMSAPNSSRLRRAILIDWSGKRHLISKGSLLEESSKRLPRPETLGVTNISRPSCRHTS